MYLQKYVCMYIYSILIWGLQPSSSHTWVRVCPACTVFSHPDGHGQCRVNYTAKCPALRPMPVSLTNLSCQLRVSTLHIIIRRKRPLLPV